METVRILLHLLDSWVIVVNDCWDIHFKFHVEFVIEAQFHHCMFFASMCNINHNEEVVSVQETDRIYFIPGTN
jgi:hypothetical protein